jgi:2-succinyl-5-enolpyruvyl-6-hydroxy-3-cyclohexene-1-carboxylate synthase
LIEVLTSESKYGSKVALATLLFKTLAGMGVAGAVMCPGSRSTVAALALADSGLEVTVGLDERAAAFFALGWAKASRAVTIISTTSGTAALETLPAIAEANLSGVPLILITSDRPRRLQGVGAAQTLDQRSPFSAHVSRTLELSLEELDPQLVVQVATELFTFAIEGPGPVQLNLNVDEPFVENRSVGYSARVLRGSVVEQEENRADFGGVDLGSKPIMLVGGEARDWLGAWAAWGLTNGIPVLADGRSGVAGKEVIRHSEAMAAWLAGKPGLVESAIVVGELQASRPIGKLLKDLHDKGRPIIFVGPDRRYRDPLRLADRFITAQPPGKPLEKSTASGWMDALSSIDQLIDDLIAAELTGFSEPGVARRLVERLDDRDLIVASSSMPVRYLDNFGPRGRRVRILSNRGANGIDGVLSSFLGAAFGFEGKAVLLIGDLAFLYDATALGQFPLPDRAKVVILENGGGVIFERVPPALVIEPDLNRRLFVTPARVDVAQVARGYGVDVMEVGTYDELFEALASPGFGVIVARFSQVDSLRTLACLDGVPGAVDAVVEEMGWSFPDFR